MKNKTNTYLIAIHYALRGLTIYKIETNDIYHVIGKLYLNSIEQIERIDYNTYTEERHEFWITCGFDVITLSRRWCE